MSAGPVLIQLTCAGCGWAVAGLMGGSNGTAPEQARRDLVRALHWSSDGKLCGYCRSVARPAQAVPVPTLSRRAG